MDAWLQDADEQGSDSAAEAGFSGGSGVAAVSFSGLYEALGASLNNERTALLLYDSLHACLNFQNYVLVRRYTSTLPPGHATPGYHSEGQVGSGSFSGA